METIKNRSLIKYFLASISLVCLLVFIILIIVQTSKRTLGEITPLLRAIYIMGGIMASLLLMVSVMEVKDYILYVRNLRVVGYHPHRLSYEQVIENESRKQIVEVILEEPGIHYNLLRKKCNLHPGQFRWHIGILLNYDIIKKKQIGPNVIFFPSMTDENYKVDLLLKFPLRETIFQFIENNPGITLSDIARKLNIPNRKNKVKYHIDKLISAGYVSTIQRGRRKELYARSS